MMQKFFDPSGMNKSVRLSLMIILGMMMGIVTVSAFAASSGDGGIAWGWMSMKLLGGLALFLFGMEQMSDALKAVAGDRMKMILAKLTGNRFIGAITGAFVTAIIQSSSVTTVLVVGFISAGLMSLTQSIGVIMGANIGTTITAQIVAFKVTKLALGMVAIGFAMIFASKREKVRHYGAILMGLGLVFYGMSVMSDAMKPLRSYQPFLDLMATMETPIIGILVAAAFTGLIQSSSATTAIVIVMASQGFVTLPAGIALAFGANIGTCVTALLASIGKPREAVRAALVHVIFNILGVAVWFFAIGYLADFVTWFSPVHPELIGTEKLAAETPRQIANAHTVFNVANTFIFIGFVPLFARLVTYLVPDVAVEEDGVIIHTKHLDDTLVDTPSLALDVTRLEIGHMGTRAHAMALKITPAILAKDKEMLMDVTKVDNEVDILHTHIIDYLGAISQRSLSTDQMHELIDLMEVAGDIENISDIIQINLVKFGKRHIEENYEVSKPTQEILRNLHNLVAKSVEDSVLALTKRDQHAAQNVIATREEIILLADSATSPEARRFVLEDPNRLPAYTLEIDIIETLKRVHYFSVRIAKTVVPSELTEVK